MSRRTVVSSDSRIGSAPLSRVDLGFAQVFVVEAETDVMLTGRGEANVRVAAIEAAPGFVGRDWR